MNNSDEEKKAIEIVKCITEDDLLNYWEGPEEPYNAIQIVLNLIQKQSKIIDLMARAIDNYDSQLVINTFENKEKVKEYFKKVVDEDVKD